MSETKWTPGPWKSRSRINQPTANVINGLDDKTWGLVIWMPKSPFVFGQVGAIVCTADKPNTETEANANLIAAAPELFEALLAVRPSFRAAGCWCGISRDIDNYGHEDACRKASLSIAKARGEA